jgi:hypothetical protein
VGELAYAALAWLEASALGETVRNAGVWTYAWLNLIHILGISSLFGAVLVLDLRLVGLWAATPVAVIAGPTVPLAAAGFLLAVLSGVSMLTVNATGYEGNPFLYAKLPLVALGLINVLVLQRLGAWRAAMAGAALSSGQRRTLAIGGAVSLLLWLAVVTCGRMIGYW